MPSRLCSQAPGYSAVLLEPCAQAVGTDAVGVGGEIGAVSGEFPRTRSWGVALWREGAAGRAYTLQVLL